MSAVSSASTIPAVEASQASVVVLSEKKQERKLTIEEQVRMYFSDEPILAEIAFCESTFRHTDKDGSVLRGVVNKGDVGVMQINEYYHKDTAERMGLDLHKLGDNLVYARYLYDKQGAQPWSASSKCWNKHLHLAQN